MSDEEEDLPTTPAYFVTIREDLETGEVQLNIGDLPFAAAFGLVMMALEEMKECRPDVLMESTEAVYYSTSGGWVEVGEDDNDEEDDSE